MLYFAYGSNMLSRRLGQRVSSARFVGVSSLSHRRLAWHKQGEDGSGKCAIPLQEGSTVYGVVFDVKDDQVGMLDKIEGIGSGYEREAVRVIIEDRGFDVFTYRATSINDFLTPYHWYKNIVIAGAREHGLPWHYIEQLCSVPSTTDENAARAQMNEALMIDSQH